MAGGTWTTQSKVRPGAYVNVKSKGSVPAAPSTNGVMTMPISIGFGPSKQVIEVNGETDFLKLLGYDLDSNALLLVREAMKRASKILLYRVSTGEKASIINGELTIEALHGGVRGNDISVTVKVNVDDPESFDVVTFIDTTVVDTQIAKTINELQPNNFVKFVGTGNLVAAAGLKLAGGSVAPVTASDYTQYFSAIQVYDFNTMALPISDESIKIAGTNFMKRMRDEEGKKSQLVVANYAANSEAVINVKNGVKLADGTVLDAVQTTSWVAAATAGAATNESLTYSAYEGAMDVDQRMTNSEIVEALQAGEFVFTEKRGTAVVEQDINSLTSFTVEKGQEFSKNRVLRVLDDIANNSKQSFEDNFVGKVNNDVDGRELFKADRIKYFNTLLASGSITNFEADDVEVLPGDLKDSVVLNVEVQPVDSMEKLYMTVVVA
ncbi:phage tail sheath family protein [Bacillaceae bacterium Marseille-Q3522]|nr:phage tail sheath family protein [Bacillaceae bacterium Marseille-Q3522]